MPRTATKPRPKPGPPRTEPPTTALTLTATSTVPDYTGADLAAVAEQLGITVRPVPPVPFNGWIHPLTRPAYPWGRTPAPLYAETVDARGVDPLRSRDGVVSGVVVEVRDSAVAS